MNASSDLPGDIAAVLDWWREAGVDCAFDDAPRLWIAAAEPQGMAAEAAAAPVAPSSSSSIASDREGWPTALAQFAEWWLNEPSLDGGQLRGRVPPRGAPGAPLMVVVPQPEAEDRDTLLSGPQGRLLAAMLAAMGLAEAQVYIASALPRHTPMADWHDLAAQGLGDVLCWHLALARPQRVIAFGRPVSELLSAAGLESPLGGNVPAQIIPGLPIINHDPSQVPLMVARDLGTLLERPIAKRHFWQHWLEWTG